MTVLVINTFLGGRLQSFPWSFAYILAPIIDKFTDIIDLSQH